MAAAKPELKVKVQKTELVKNEPKLEAKVKKEVKPGTNTKQPETLEEMAARMRMKRENAVHAKQEVKRERRQAKPRRKPRVTAKRRNSSREVINRPRGLSPEMADFLGDAALSRPEVVRRIWAYGKDKDLLNPANKKELRCDSKLKKLLGLQTVTIFELQKCVTEHLDLTVPVEPAPSPKRQRKSEPKQELKKQELKEEKKEEKIKSKGSSSKKEEKKELADACKSESSAARAETAAKGLLLHLNGLLQQRLSVEFTTTALDLDQLRFQVVAVPSKPATNEVRSPCNSGIREDADGNFQSFGEGKLDGLTAGAAYTVFVEVEGSGQKFRSMELSIPQRSRPEKWTAHEVQLWASTLRVPEFTRKLVAYAVDGSTLLTLGEADLRGLGLVAPFLLRRVSDALKVVSGWSV